MAHNLSAEQILLTRVKFRFRSTCNVTAVWLTGNSAALGNWLIAAPVPLHKIKYRYVMEGNRNDHLWWESEVSLPSDISVEYRYMVSQKGSRSKRAEKRGRELEPTGLACTVLDTQEGFRPALSTRERRQKLICDFGWLHEDSVQLRVWIGQPFGCCSNQFQFKKGISNGISLIDPSNLITHFNITLRPADLFTVVADWVPDNPQRSPFVLIAQNPKLLSFFVEVEIFKEELETEDSPATHGHLQILDLEHFRDEPKSSSRVNKTKDQSKRPAASGRRKTKRTVSTVLIHHSALKHLRGRMVHSLIDREGNFAGTVDVTYLVSLPFFPNTRSTPPRDQKMDHEHEPISVSLLRNAAQQLQIGHRGFGSTRGPGNNFLFTENTLLSFLAASRLDFHYVEFDVQLTRDMVPIVAHDPEIIVGIEDTRGGTIKIHVPVNKLRLEKLRRMKPLMDMEEESPLPLRQMPPNSTNPQSPSPSSKIDNREEFANMSIRQHCEHPFRSVQSDDDLLQLDKKERRRKKNLQISSVSIPKQVPVKSKPPIWGRMDTYPTLEELFESLPSGLGFDIEIKYPDEEDQDPCESPFDWFDDVLDEKGAITQSPWVQEVLEARWWTKRCRKGDALERNAFVDSVLDVVFSKAEGRPLLFSSFDPDICQLLALKQITYPVFFLTEGEAQESDHPSLSDSGSGVPHKHRDTRWSSVFSAIEFAINARLHGIVVDSRAILGQNLPDIVSTIHENGLLLFTYGEANNSEENIRIQKKHRVDAVISDRNQTVSTVPGITGGVAVSEARTFRVKEISQGGEVIGSNPLFGTWWKPERPSNAPTSESERPSTPGSPYPQSPDIVPKFFQSNPPTTTDGEGGGDYSVDHDDGDENDLSQPDNDPPAHTLLPHSIPIPGKKDSLYWSSGLPSL